MKNIILVIFAVLFVTVVFNLPTFDEAVDAARARAVERALAK